jgi:hypothetical protein
MLKVPSGHVYRIKDTLGVFWVMIANSLTDIEA